MTENILNTRSYDNMLYNNIKRKRSWGYPSEPPKAVPKAGLHPKKVLLSIWWDWQGILYFELLPSNPTINSDVYCDRLEKLKTVEQEKRLSLSNLKGIIFQHDNAKPLASLKTRKKLLELNWDVLPHPPYSPDLVPSDFHLLRSLQKFLDGENFSGREDIKLTLLQYLPTKGKNILSREF